MKVFLSFLFLLIYSNPEVEEIRKIYPTASASEQSIKELQSKLSDVTMESSKVLVAYKGASIAMLTKYIKKISEKKENFKEGVKWIEYAVKSKPNSIEIRMIRLSVQENTPKIARYHTNIEEDKSYIMAHYNDESGNLKEYIRGFILRSKSFSAAEKEKYK